MRSTSLQATQPVKARVASHPSPYNLKGMIRLKLAFWSLIRDTYRDKNIYNDTDAWYPKHEHTPHTHCGIYRFERSEEKFKDHHQFLNKWPETNQGT